MTEMQNEKSKETVSNGVNQAPKEIPKEEPKETAGKTSEETAGKASEETADKSSEESAEKASKEATAPKEKPPGNKLLIILSVVLVLAGTTALILLGRTLGDRKQYEGKQWYGDIEEGDRAADTLSGMEVFAAQGAGDSSLAESWTYGNDMQIYRSGAMVAMDENYYYAANAQDGGRLYRISREGSGQREKITEIPASMISLREDRLYFVSGYENGSNARGIYGVNTDGTQLEYLSDAVPENMIMVNDWLYYVSANDSHIYKLNVRERREIQLTDKSCVSMTMQGNTIFFSYQEETETETEDTVQILASIDVDGNFYQELGRDIEYHDLMYMDGRIYYISEGWLGLCSVNPDGTDLRTVFEIPNQFAEVQIYGGNIYYKEYTEDGRQVIGVYNSETGATGHYNPEYVIKYFLFDGKIYVNYLEGTEEKVSVHNLEDGSLIPFFE